MSLAFKVSKTSGGTATRPKNGCAATITLLTTVAYSAHFSWAKGDVLVYQPPQGVRVLNAPAPAKSKKTHKAKKVPPARPTPTATSYGSSAPHATGKPPAKGKGAATGKGGHTQSHTPPVRFAIPRPRRGHSTVMLKITLSARPVQVRDRHGHRHTQISARLGGTLTALKGHGSVAHLSVSGLVAVTCAAPKTRHHPTATPTPKAGGQTPPTASSVVTVTIHNFAFAPQSLTIAAGTTVVWINQDAAAHTVTATDNSWGSKTLKTGQTYSRVFTTPGTFPYFCAIHPYMKASITVTAPPTPLPGAPTATPAPASAPTSTPQPAPAPPTQAPAPGQTLVQVSIRNFAYSPLTINVAPGTTVMWTNLDAAPHTVTADDGSWASDLLDQGASFSHTFTTPGTYNYHCQVHPFMQHAVVIVGSPPPTVAPTAVPPTAVPTATSPPPPTATPTATAMVAPTNTPTSVPTATATPSPTATLPLGANTPTPGPTSTPTRVVTATPTSTVVLATATPTHTPIPAPTATPTHTPVPAPTSTPVPTSVAVSIQNFAFSPATITVAQGTTVTWTNLDSAMHTVTATDGSWGSSLTNPLAQGDTYSHTFTGPGTYTYICAIHPFMQGTVIVTAS